MDGFKRWAIGANTFHILGIHCEYDNMRVSNDRREHHTIKIENATRIINNMGGLFSSEAQPTARESIMSRAIIDKQCGISTMRLYWSCAYNSYFGRVRDRVFAILMCFARVGVPYDIVSEHVLPSLYFVRTILYNCWISSQINVFWNSSAHNYYTRRLGRCA